MSARGHIDHAEENLHYAFQDDGDRAREFGLAAAQVHALLAVASAITELAEVTREK